MTNNDELLDMDNPGGLDPNWGSVKPNTPVLANNGQRIGAVQEVRSDGLYVRGDAQGTDYMVTPTDIGSIDNEGVHLVVSEAQAMRANG